MKKIFLLASLLFSLNVFAQVPSYVPTSGLVAWYPFNANANDESGNGNNGVANGATLTFDRNGNSNSAYYFSSVGCATRIDATINTSSIQTGLTISIWVLRVGDGCIGPRLLEFWANNGPGQAQWTWDNSSSLVGPGSTTSSGFNCYTSVPISPNNNIWTNIIYTNDGAFGRFYANGILTSSLASTGNPILSGNASFGRMNHPGYDALNGNLDDIGIWNRALTQTEITALYNGCTTATISTTSSLTICGSGSVLLTANSNTSYQWKKNNVAVTGATNQTYSATATGSYTVTATNACSTTSTSNAIQVTKYSLPTCTIAAGGATSFCTGNSVTLTSTTNAGANALYQWYKGTAALAGATNSTYIATTAGNFKCKVTNSATTCSKTSAVIAVAILDPTSSITASGPLTFCTGGNVLFTAVTNAGAGALYQWYKNSAGLAGATNSTYTATVAGNYIVVVTNSSGCTKASAVKKVVINCRLDGETMQTIFVTPNPCSSCFVGGEMDEQNLMVTDIIGRKINVQFTKSENGFYINMPEAGAGLYIIRNIKSGEVVKFVRE